MKRDLDLVRKILLAMEAEAHGFAPAPFTIPGYDQEVIGHHVLLMIEGRLITGVAITAQGDGSPTALPGSITWTGHEFLDATRTDRVWTKIKTEMKDRGVALPFTLVQELALKLLKGMTGLD